MLCANPPSSSRTTVPHTSGSNYRRRFSKWKSITCEAILPVCWTPAGAARRHLASVRSSGGTDADAQCLAGAGNGLRLWRLPRPYLPAQLSGTRNPALAEKATRLLADAGIAAALDSRCGYDHGAFVPMLVIEPDAGIPLVSISLQSDLDPAFHLAVGSALEPLRDENVLIIGSGNSFHNNRAIYDGARQRRLGDVRCLADRRGRAARCRSPIRTAHA